MMNNVPKLRFEGFSGEWEEKKLKSFSKVIKEKMGGNSYTLMSIESGVGLISQINKFGREIAGESSKNYIVLRKNNFAYNKSATKNFPQGFIALHDKDETVAVPNSIFTCFEVDTLGICPDYLKFLFLKNLHGKWLAKFIAVGARAHGSLNVDNKDLFSLPVPLPSLPEQQKIADCLSSLDEAIFCYEEELSLLKDHKKGLLQNLFPKEGEKVPALRFEGFSGEWEEKALGDLGNFKNGINKSASEFGFGSPFVNLQDVFGNTVINENQNFGLINASDKDIREYSLESGDVLFIRSSVKKEGVGVTTIVEKNLKNTIYSGFLIRFRAKDSLSNDFKKYCFSTTYFRGKLVSKATTSANTNINQEALISLSLSFPSLPEQQKIADCLSSLDETINAHEEELNKLKEHKKGLLQNLFPQN